MGISAATSTTPGTFDDAVAHFQRLFIEDCQVGTIDTNCDIFCGASQRFCGQSGLIALHCFEQAGIAIDHLVDGTHGCAVVGVGVDAHPDFARMDACHLVACDGAIIRHPHCGRRHGASLAAIEMLRFMTVREVPGAALHCTSTSVCSRLGNKEVRVRASAANASRMNAPATDNRLMG